MSAEVEDESLPPRPWKWGGLFYPQPAPILRIKAARASKKRMLEMVHLFERYGVLSFVSAVRRNEQARKDIEAWGDAFIDSLKRKKLVDDASTSDLRSLLADEPIPEQYEESIEAFLASDAERLKATR
jgi:hypothetical protein